MTTPEISGFTSPGFDALRDAFAENFHDRGDVGAATSVFIDGHLVAHLWAGEARPGQPWTADTMAPVFSTTKGPTALVAQVLADQGLLDVDRPIRSFWPEFGTLGKEDITVWQVLTHTSGVIDFPGYEEVLDDQDFWLDLDGVAAALAGASPAWQPGTSHGYHGVTMGYLIGEVVRRITGTTLGSVFRRLVGEPLDADVFIGLPAEHDARVAALIDAPPPTDPLVQMYLSMFNPSTLTGRAHFSDHRGVDDVADRFNDPAAWRAEAPSLGGIASALGLARMYDALARDGAGVVSPPSIAAHTAEQVRGPDLVLLFETRFALGYMRPTPFVNLGPSDAAFGHGGLGGSVAFADPAHRVAFAYVPNQLMFPATGSTTRAGALVNALYESLAP